MLVGAYWSHSPFRWRDIYGYVRDGEARPQWFVTERVLGNLGLPPEGRKGYEACIEGRMLELGLKRGRKELAETSMGKRGVGVVVVPAHHGAAAG